MTCWINQTEFTTDALAFTNLSERTAFSVKMKYQNDITEENELLTEYRFELFFYGAQIDLFKV